MTEESVNASAVLFVSLILSSCAAQGAEQGEALPALQSGELPTNTAPLDEMMLGFIDRYILGRIDCTPTLDDAVWVAFPHAVYVIVAARRCPDRAFEIERYQAGFDAGCCEFVKYFRFGFRCPVPFPVFGKCFDIGSLAVNPLLRAWVTMKVDNSHAQPPAS